MDELKFKHRVKILKSCIFPICLLFNHHSAATEKAAFNFTIHLKVKTLLKKFHVLDKLIFGCKPKKRLYVLFSVT